MNAIVIGAGADELVAARILAKAGRRVTVLREFPRVDGAAGWVPASMLHDLGIGGVGIENPDPWLRVPLPAGGTLELWRDMARSVEAIRGVSPRDAGRWPQFSERMRALAGLLERIYAAPAPGFLDLGLALRVRRLGRRGMQDLMRWLAMPAAELLDEWFECDALKGALGALALRNLKQGPRSAGSAFHLLHQHAGCPSGVFRAPRSNLWERLAEGSDFEVREAKAERIAVRAGRAAAVVLSGGEELPASLVVSGADPRRTLTELVEPGWLDPELARALRHVRSRGAAARITLEFERAARFATMTLAPSLDYLEHAYDDAKCGRASARPFLDVLADGTRAHVHLQYAPFELSQGIWDDAARGRLAAVALRMLDGSIPAVRASTVLAPPDLAELYGWPQGQPHHAELSLDQALWMRPLPELARYRTPIEALWLCGPAMHPAVAGLSGYNCARSIVSTLRA